MDTFDESSSRSRVARHRKLILKIQYLEAELEEVEECMSLAKHAFSKSYAECLAAYPREEIEKVWAKIENISPPSEPTVMQGEGDEKEVKKLFRKVAGETHPDKLEHMNNEEQEFRTGMFEKAKKACKELNWYELSKLAETLKLTIPTLSESHVNMLEKSANLLHQKIEMVKITAAWQWYGIKSSQERDNFMHNYLKTLM